MTQKPVAMLRAARFHCIAPTLTAPYASSLCTSRHCIIASVHHGHDIVLHLLFAADITLNCSLDMTTCFLSSRPRTLHHAVFKQQLIKRPRFSDLKASRNCSLVMPERYCDFRCFSKMLRCGLTYVKNVFLRGIWMHEMHEVADDLRRAIGECHDA